MSTAERKARKRAGLPFAKTAKTPTRPYKVGKRIGLGLVSPAELMAAVLIRGDR